MVNGQIGQNGAPVPWNVAVEIKHAQGLVQRSEWSICTLECGSENQTRTRTCTNPEPQFNGEDCGEGDSETQACNKDPCPIGNFLKLK